MKLKKVEVFLWYGEFGVAEEKERERKEKM